MGLEPRVTVLMEHDSFHDATVKFGSFVHNQEPFVTRKGSGRKNKIMTKSARRKQIFHHNFGMLWH